MNVFFSLIIPVYNVRKYLDENIDSIMRQDFPREKFEVICVDDGSTDGSSERLDYYKQQYSNIVVIHQENQGVSAARNTGITIAKGEYIWFVDSDDIIAPDALSYIFSKLQNLGMPEKLKFGSWACYETVTYEECCKIRVEEQIPNYDYLSSVVWNCVLKRKFINDNDVRFNTTMSYAEDTVFMMTTLTKNPSSAEVKDILYFHRQNPTSLMSSKDEKHNRKRIDSEIEAAKQYRKLLMVQSDYHETIERKFGYAILQALSRIQSLEKSLEKMYLKEMRAANLFPCKTIQGCVNKDIFVGRSHSELYYFLYCHLNTLWGYHTMKMFKKIADRKRRLGKIS